MKMNKKINLKKNILNNKKISQSILKKVIISKPLLSKSYKNNKKEIQSNNLKISSTLTIFPLSKNQINLKHLKNARTIMRNIHFSSTPNINSFNPSINNKNSLLTHQSFNYRYIKPKTPVDLSLYTILALSKNNFLGKYDKDIIMNNKKQKKNNLKAFINKEYINECKEKIKNENMIESKKDMVYLSCLNNNFINSEKMRFYNMMEKLKKTKLMIELNPKHKYKIIKIFFIDLGLDNPVFFRKNKMNNFLKFIKKEFIVDPTKTFKNNIINIINNNNDYICYQNNLKNYGNILPSPNKTINKRIKNIIHMNKNLYRNLKYNSFDKSKFKRYDLDLRENMNKQKEINKRDNKNYLDIIKNPGRLMSSLEDKIKEGKNNIKFDKTYANWSRNIGYNNYLDFKVMKSYDMDILKKRHLLTEYACYERAKNNFDFQKFKTFYNV